MTDWPADKVERRAVAALIPYARNARTHSDAQVAQIAASITEWGWTIPILIGEDTPAYCDVAVRRWEQFTGQQATHEQTGRTFAETANFPTIKAPDGEPEAQASRRTA